jgi:hypothetical protein
MSVLTRTPITIRIGNLIENVDMFGHPINLTYNRKPSYKTVFGGVISIIAGGLIFAYFISSIY